MFVKDCNKIFTFGEDISVMEKVITDIKTDKWNEIISVLKNEGWKVVSEYDLFDKGIDFDGLELVKDQQRIILAWDNWFEGELLASEEVIEFLEKKIELELKFGNPEHLTPRLTESFRKGR